jgi:hypothetical protein
MATWTHPILSVDRHWTVSSWGYAAAWTVMCKYFVHTFLISPEYIPRRGITNTFGNSIFSILRKCQTFPKCFQLYIPLPEHKVSISPQPHQKFLSLTIVIWVGTKCAFGDLIYISLIIIMLIIRAFIYLLWKKCLFSPFANVSIGLCLFF